MQEHPHLQQALDQGLHNRENGNGNALMPRRQQRHEQRDMAFMEVDQATASPSLFLTETMLDQNQQRSGNALPHLKPRPIRKLPSALTYRCETLYDPSYSFIVVQESMSHCQNLSARSRVFDTPSTTTAASSLEEWAFYPDGVQDNDEPLPMSTALPAHSILRPRTLRRLDLFSD